MNDGRQAAAVGTDNPPQGATPQNSPPTSRTSNAHTQTRAHSSSPCPPAQGGPTRLDDAHQAQLARRDLGEAQRAGRALAQLRAAVVHQVLRGGAERGRGAMLVRLGGRGRRGASMRTCTEPPGLGAASCLLCAVAATAPCHPHLHDSWEGEHVPTRPAGGGGGGEVQTNIALLRAALVARGNSMYPPKVYHGPTSQRLAN